MPLLPSLLFPWIVLGALFFSPQLFCVASILQCCINKSYEIGTKFTFSVVIIPSRARVALESVSDVPAFVKNVTTTCAPQSLRDCCVKIRWADRPNAIIGMKSYHASLGLSISNDGPCTMPMIPSLASSFLNGPSRHSRATGTEANSRITFNSLGHRSARVILQSSTSNSGMP